MNPLTLQKLTLLKKSLDQLKIGIYVYHLEDLIDDRSLKLIDLNHYAEIYTGIEKNDCINKTLDENFPLLREQGIPQLYAQIIRDQTQRELGEIHYQDKRVKPNWYTVNAFYLENNLIAITFTNITQKKQKDEKFNEQLKKLERINKILIGREHQMIELKNEIKELKKQLESNE